MWIAMVGFAVVALCLGDGGALAADGPDVLLGTASLVFADRPVGSTADAQVIQLTNTGAAPLAISTFRITGAASGDFAQGSLCPVAPDTLAPGASCATYVSFTPHDVGVREAVFAVGDDAPSSPQTVVLRGGGTATPQAQVAPSSLTFGDVAVGDHTASQTVTLTNTGAAPLALSGIAVTGVGAADFSTLTTCDVLLGVPPGGSCQVDVAFAPHALGARTASLVFTDNAAGGQQSVALSGTAAPAPGPAVGLGAAALDFGTVTAGTTSAAQHVTVTNTGNAPLAVQSIAVTAGESDFAQTNDCPSAVAPGGTCNVSVTLTPSATGARAGTLTIATDAPDSPHRVALSGAAVAPGTYFSDDFESGSLRRWDALSSDGSTIALDGALSHSGASSVRFTNSGADESSRLMADLAGGGHAQTYTRFCFRIAPGLTQGIEIANGRAITAEYPLGIRRFLIDFNPATNGLEGYFFNEGLQRLDLYAANGRVTPGVWHCLELYLDERADGRAEIWLDGSSVGSVEGDLATPDPYGRLYLWNQPAAGSVWFDDVEVSSSRGAGSGDTPPTGPVLGVSPLSLDFGGQNTGSVSAARAVTLTNGGSGDLTVPAIAAGGGEFAQTNDCPALLAPAASCVVSVTFAPTSTGARTGTLSVGSTAVPLTGAGLIAGVYLQDDFEHGLGAWSPLSSTSSSIAADTSFANSGSTSVRMTNAADLESSRLMADLAGGGQAQTYTRFCFRVEPGLRDGIEIANGRAITAEYPLGIRRFVIDYNPITKGLEGYFFNEALQRLDMSAAVGRVLTGRWYCAELYLDERADGHARLWLDGVLVGSVDGDLSTPSPYGRLYLWNQPTDGSVWFDDVAVADHQLGPVGEGAAELPGPRGSLDTSGLVFGSQAVQTVSGARTATITNSGDARLTVYGTSITGVNAADFVLTGSCAGTLAPGASCTASVVFAPSAAGARSASLSFADDASGSPHTVALSGTGTVPDAGAATPAPTSLAFGDQAIGAQSAARSITLTNTGTSAMAIASISVTGPNAAEFTRTTTCGATLGVGVSCSIDVTFAPAATGARAATLVVDSDAVNAPTSVAVSGNGIPPAGTFLTDNFDAGLSSWRTIGDGTVSAVGGTAALTNAAAGGYSGIYADFGPQARTTTRFCFDLTGVVGPTVLAQGRDANGMPLWEIDYDPGYAGLDVYAWSGARTRTDLYTAFNVVTQDQWHCVELDFAEAATGRVAVRVDGIAWASADADLSAADAYSRLFLWNNGAAGTVSLDDVSVTAL